jgi:ribosomal protein S18 acetylase RimI-like enzyme
MHMLLQGAEEADYPAIVELANASYRGSGPGASWNMEKGILDGQRMDDALLREELAERPDGFLMTYREQPGGPLLGTFWLDPKRDGVWYLSLFMVRPDRQNQRLGRALLETAEEFARKRGGTRMRMSVLQVRTTLIAWYERRGYRATGETQPFPYGDTRLGKPLRDDLYFLVFEKQLA